MFENIILSDDDAYKNLKGQLVASIVGNTFRENSGPTELILHRTKDNQFVCQKIVHSLWARDPGKHKSMICDSLDKVFEFFGDNWLAKDLYKIAGFACANV